MIPRADVLALVVMGLPLLRGAVPEDVRLTDRITDGLMEHVPSYLSGERPFCDFEQDMVVLRDRFRADPWPLLRLLP
jgi:hypothetical protein